LRRVFATLDQHGQFTEDDVDTIMNELDTSKDGVIDYFEFAAWLKGDSPSEAEHMKRKFKNAASKTLTPEQTVARLEEELRKAEETQTFPNSVEVFLDDHHL
jgi:Ca2+-binding EF-hand superfamily protein